MFFDIILPDIIFMKVVFPEPEGPMRAVNDEGLKLPDIGCKIILFSYLT